MNLNEIKYTLPLITPENKLSADLLVSGENNRAVSSSDVTYWNSKAEGDATSQTVFNADGSITETTAAYTNNTVFNADGSITETKVKTAGGTVTKTTTFNADGSINVVVVES